MAAPLVKTTTRGIYKRGSRYVFSYRVGGRQRWESCRTLDEARRAKAARMTDIARGEFAERSQLTLHRYLLGDPQKREAGWIDRYRGTGKRGFREETRAEYRGLLERYALRFFSEKVRLVAITPYSVAQFVAWLCDGRAMARLDHDIECERARKEGRRPPKPLPLDAKRELSDRTVRNVLKPLRTALSTARSEGLIRHNPCDGVRLPHRERIEDDEDLPRPFPNGVMELVVQLVHPRHRLMFELLAATGLRRSELLALEVRHLHLAGDRPHVKVRQRVRRRRGEGLIVGPLKSRHARRDVPIPVDLADRLRGHIAGREATALVFASQVGTLLDPDNMAERVLAPACAEAGVEWAGFHTFRHTVASRLFAGGRNPVQVQHWLGHHSAAFTMGVYVHLLEGDLGEPLTAQPVTVDLMAADGQGSANAGANRHHATPLHDGVLVTA